MRFLSEISLRLEGDRDKAAKYISRARTVLGELWNREIELGGHEQAWRKLTLEGGAVQIDVRVIRTLPPIVRIFATSTEETTESSGTYLLLAAWYPEGLLFTPRSAAYPQGRGLPSRNPTTGVTSPSPADTNPVFPNVLMNRYPNNRYLDRPGFITGTVGAADGMSENPPQLRPDPTVAEEFQRTTFRYWYKLSRPLDYNDADGAVAFTYDGFEYWLDGQNQDQFPTIAGEYLITEDIVDGTAVSTATLVTEQRDRITGGENLFEPESPDTWYSHRPEEVLYPTAGHEKIFTQTNVFRGLFGAPPVLRQLRGDGNPALIAVSEVAKSGDLSHNSLNFQPGFRTADGKVLNASGVDEASGENLAAGFTGTTEAVGEDVADAWFGSTGHRNNMLSTAWDNDNTIPGAMHSIGYTEGTITEQSENIPDINTYPGGTISGGIWSQVFHKRPTWVPVWEHTFSGDYGETGWNGLGSPADNTALITANAETLDPIPYQAFFGFRGCRYALPNSADEPRAIRVLGAAVYAKEVTVGEAPDEEIIQELWFRVALLLNDVGEDYLNETPAEFGNGTIKVFTAPVGVTESNYKDRYGYYEPDKNRAWELEDEYDFPFTPDGTGSGWLYPAYATAAISPDGRKFCFTYQKYKVATQPLFHRSSTDFTQTTNRDVMVAWFVHIEKEIDEDFVLHEQAPPTANVSAATVVNTPGNYRHNYTRTLNTTYNYMPYYNDENILNYVQLSIDDYQTQQYTGYMWRVRKLIFGSGKEVYLDYQFMENFITPADLDAFKITHPTAPVDGDESESFRTIIHFLDPVNEDVVLTRSYAAFVERDPNNTWDNWGYDGRSDYLIDLGSGAARIQEVLASRSFTQDLSTDQFLVNVISPPMSAGFPWQFVGGVRELDTRTSYMIYNYKAPVALTATIAIFGEFNCIAAGVPYPEGEGWYAFGVQSPHVHFYGPYAGSAGDQYDPTEYGPYDTQGMYNAADYEVSVWQPPPKPGEYGKDNLYQEPPLFDDQIDASLYTDNVSPLYTSFEYSTTRVVRYKDRIILRADFTYLIGEMIWQDGYVNGPYPTSAQALAAPNYPPPYFEFEVLSVDARLNNDIMLWANFDLDAAAEISDVTDISPFGRAV